MRGLAGARKDEAHHGFAGAVAVGGSGGGRGGGRLLAHEREEIYERPPVGHGLLAAERAQGIQEVVGRRVPVEPGSQPNRGVLQW